jgi:high-affinity iron transporter
MESALLRAGGCFVAALCSILFAAGDGVPGGEVPGQEVTDNRASDGAVSFEPDGASIDDEMHRALGMLNYFIGDYPLAVSDDGQILNDFEYREQLGLLASLRAILSEPDARAVHRSDTTSSLRRDIDALCGLVDEQRSAPDVLGQALNLRDALVARYELELSPAELPSLARGRELYGRACSVCHGAVGRGRTPAAQRLDPRPTDLLSRHLDQTLSPYQTFNIVTFGVDGTAMPAFAALSAAERWDLAFYVMAMRQRAVPRAGVSRLDPPLEVLARSTDEELARWLAEHGVPANRLASEIARLRRGPARASGDRPANAEAPRESPTSAVQP